VTKKRATEEAADRVRAAILAGELTPGSDLPGERELAERLGISRLTLRSALARLETEGLVQPVHGSGTRVLDYRETGGIDLIGYLAAQALEGGVVPFALLSDLMELRRMVGVELLTLVSQRASDEELRELDERITELAGLIGEPEFMSKDLEFARAVVRAGKNLALELLYNTVGRILDGHPGLVLAFSANAEQTITVYRRLLELVRSRDAERVGTVARKLLVRLDHMTLKRVAAITGQSPDAGPDGGET
jgi:DNA-binding FadR family transcriptional regulator